MVFPHRLDELGPSKVDPNFNIFGKRKLSRAVAANRKMAGPIFLQKYIVSERGYQNLDDFLVPVAIFTRSDTIKPAKFVCLGEFSGIHRALKIFPSRPNWFIFGRLSIAENNFLPACRKKTGDWV